MIEVRQVSIKLTPAAEDLTASILSGGMKTISLVTEYGVLGMVKEQVNRREEGNMEVDTTCREKFL